LIRGIEPAEVEAALRRFGLSERRRRIAYSGRLVPIKRVDLALDAFARIAADRPEWDLLVIGGGEKAQELKARVPPDLVHRVTWTGFLDDQRTVSALYRGSDVLLLPSDNEPWAVVVNEAAAAGLAIVASDVVGAAAELVRDGVNGAVFRRSDLHHLVERLLDVTSQDRIELMKSASEGVLRDWQNRADPVHGLREALRFVGVIR
jgi:glycosyltransferase involved in cell wall biosynthesis